MRDHVVVYVCGNHDDHLNRYGLGGELAQHLHPARGAFAAEALLVPAMVAVFEQGHRGDTFNVAEPRIGYVASLGELLVSLMVNPSSAAA